MPASFERCSISAEDSCVNFLQTWHVIAYWHQCFVQLFSTCASRCSYVLGGVVYLANNGKHLQIQMDAVMTVCLVSCLWKVCVNLRALFQTKLCTFLPASSHSCNILKEELVSQAAQMR